MSCGGGPGSTPSPVEKEVYIKKEKEKYTLMKGGEPFIIKGASGDGNIRALKEAGGNCLRVYDTLNLASILDSAQANDIAVMVGLPLPKSKYIDLFYNNPEWVKTNLEAYRRLVSRFKNHPSLLIWGLGNELDFPFSPKYSSFYAAINSLIDMIHQEDGQHPVTTSLMSFQKRTILNIRLKIPDLDFLSINTFGYLTTLQEDLEGFKWVWDGPYMVTEWGVNGYWEEKNTAWMAPLENTSWKKAEQLKERYSQTMPINDPRFLGSYFFYWGYKMEKTKTWFSTHTEKGKPTETILALKSIWQDTEPKSNDSVPHINYSLIDGKGGERSIICTPGSKHTAELKYKINPKDSIEITWQIVEEDWYSVKLEKKPPINNHNTLFVSEKGNQLVFSAPKLPGPYRLYCWASYKSGFTATTNTPFYVIE